MRSARIVALTAMAVLLCTACPAQKSTTKLTAPSTAPSSVAPTASPATTTFTTTSDPSATTSPAASTTAAQATSSGPTAAPAATTTPTAQPTTAQPTTAKPAAPTTTATAPVTTVAAPNPCSAIDFRNFTYNSSDWGVVTVVDGQGTRGTPSAADYVALQIRAVVSGDIGGSNGNAETAVFTNANTGGTGQFSDVQIFTCTAKVATRITSAGVGDRAYDGVRAISISDRKLYIDRFTDASGACCPGAAIRQGFTLVGSTLSVVGPGAKRRFLSLDGDASIPEVPISFLPGTSGALVSGDTATARPGGLDASAGQRFTLVVEAAPPGLPNVVLELLQGATVVATATSAGSASVTLPATAHYRLRARPATAGADNGFDAEITIT